VRLAVVGGGIAGLAAALRLRDRVPDAQITVYEKDPALGGKLRTGSLAELGADGFLAHDPAGGESAAVALARRLGLADDLVRPAPVPAALLLDDRLQAIPGGTLFGIPGDPESVAAIAKPEPDRDTDQGRPVLGPGEDVAVGALVRRRLGDDLVDRLVDPLLGGVYAGRADALSLAATMPALAAACRTGHTLTGAVRVVLAERPPPAFCSVRGGLTRLVEAVAAAVGATVRLGTQVRALSRTASGWRLSSKAGLVADQIDVDGVVLAVPARPAARLLGELVPALDYASVALVTLALPEPTVLPGWSGFLAPPGLTVKAAMFLTRKWPQLAGVLVRASVGRYGEVDALQLTDQALAERVQAELAEVLGGLPAPVDVEVQRWGGALPQYPPGHLERVAAARSALPGAIGLAGAAFDGVGIPACIRSGEAAADQVLTTLEQSMP
jgi:oxygen-dependent protoporphyrinogen oxidase